MMRAIVGPARALALAGVLAVAVLPGVASAQRARAVYTVDISPADAQIQVGQQQAFIANAYDRGNNPVAATLTFHSSNAAVATIDANGIAVGVAPGAAIITARTGTGATAKSATATLTVVGGGAVVPQAVGPSAAPAGPTPAATPAAGPRPLSARPGAVGNAALDHQSVGAGAPIGLRVRPFQATLVRGEYLTLHYEALNANGDLAVPVPLVFNVDSAGSRMVEVDTVGVVKALGDTGTTTVRIAVPNNPNIQQRPVTVVVKGDSVRFSDTELWVTVGTVDTLVLVVPSQDRRRFNAPPGHFQFESSDESKVQVNAMVPVFTASAQGSVQISGRGSAYYHPVVTVHVLPPVVTFRLTPAESLLTLVMNSTRTVAAQPLAADSAIVSQARLRWILPDSNIARFDTATRTLRGVRMGETRLGIAAPYSRDSLTKSWWRIRVVAGGLVVSPTRLGLGVGERAPVSVQLLDDRRQPIPGPATNLRWASSADSIARFADGAVQGLKVGHARLAVRTSWDSVVHTDVFVSEQLLASVQRGGRWDLYEFSADSAPRFVPITNDAAVELEPAFSPDLTRIAYVTAPVDRPSSQDLYVVNADGSDPLRLTNDSATVTAPVFVRPNGEQIVFQSNKGGRAQLYIINRDGTGRRQLTSGDAPNTQPDASPDGRKLLFVSLRQPAGGSRNYDVWEIRVDGTGERRLTTSPRPDDSPRYAPDGRSFYYLRDEGGSPKTKRIYSQALTDSTGATAQPITPLGMFVRAFSMSADGNYLVLTRLETVPRVGDVQQVMLFTLANGALLPIRAGTGEQLTAPTFRPATPTIPATPPTSAPAPAAPAPAAAPTARPPQ